LIAGLLSNIIGVSENCLLIASRLIELLLLGHLPTAFHLDSNLMLTEPASFQTAVQGLLRAQRSAIEARTCGEHLCFMGSGRIEEDQYAHMVVASFLQKGTQFVSLLSGGYASIHDYFGDQMLDCLEDHDVLRCLVCNKTGVVYGNNNNVTRQVPSSSKQLPQQPQVKQFDLFSKLSSAMKSKTSDVKTKLFDYMATPAPTQQQQQRAEEATEKHVLASEKNGKRYRNTPPVFGLVEDDDDGDYRDVMDGGSSLSDAKDLLNIQSYIKGNNEIVTHFKCQEVQINGMMHESFLILTPKRIEVIRELENGMGRMHVQRPLSQIVKITAKKRHRDLITFKYGQPDGDNLIITGELRKIALLLIATNFSLCS